MGKVLVSIREVNERPPRSGQLTSPPVGVFISFVVLSTSLPGWLLRFPGRPWLANELRLGLWSSRERARVARYPKFVRNLKAQFMKLVDTMLECRGATKADIQVLGGISWKISKAQKRLIEVPP